jgi:hypothetical protein
MNAKIEILAEETLVAERAEEATEAVAELSVLELDMIGGGNFADLWQ